MLCVFIIIINKAAKLTGEGTVYTHIQSLPREDNQST